MSTFLNFLCNHLIIRDAFLCFFYTVGLIHDVFITCYFTAYKKVRYELFWIKLCPFKINRHVAIGTMDYLGRGSPNHCLIRLIDIAKTWLSKFANILVSNT